VAKPFTPFQEPVSSRLGAVYRFSSDIRNGSVASVPPGLPHVCFAGRFGNTSSRLIAPRPA